MTGWVCCVGRRFGTKCAGCAQGISPSDLVRKARSKVFHLNCFTCMVCNKQLSTGEELYVIDENKFVCKDDYLSSSSLKEGSLNSGRASLRRQPRPRSPPPLCFPARAELSAPRHPAGSSRGGGRAPGKGTALGPGPLDTTQPFPCPPPIRGLFPGAAFPVWSCAIPPASWELSVPSPGPGRALTGRRGRSRGAED